MEKRIAKIFSSSLLRNAGKLATGTVVAQMLSLAFIPIISRIYPQEAYGFLAAFSAVVSFVSSFATLKYDTALVLPKDDKDAYSLLKLSNIITILITTVSVLVMFLPIPYFEEYRGLQIFIGIGVLLSVNYNNSALWNIRFKQFNHTAISSIIQSIAIFGFQFILYRFFELKGLIIGNVFGIAVSGVYLILTRKFNWSDYRGITKAQMSAQAKRYIDFPKYFTLSNAVLSFSSNLPILLFVNYIPMAQIGVYGMALKIIAQPVTLVTNSLKSVILGEMAERKNDKKPILRWFLKIFFSLFFLAVIASILLIISGDFIVDIVLGQEWADVSVYAKVLIPILIGSLIASPGIAAVRVFEMQKYNFRYSLVSLALKGGALLGLFSWSGFSFEYIVAVYALVNLVLIVGNNVVIIKKIGQYEKYISINKV